MTDTLPDQEPVIERMENDKDEMFVSAMDSPTDSGLETNKTSNSDTMEDLSLQVTEGKKAPLGETLQCLFSG